MIKIKRTAKPTELTDEIRDALTKQYKTTNEAVWNKPYIKKALLEMSHNKCAYCELKLSEEGKFLQVEHFHCKKLYPNEVVIWENLLPSCNRCNINKSSHDTISEPIINPCNDNPSDYLYMENYRIKSKNHNSLGQTTIDILYLNESESLVLPRFNIGNKVLDKIETIHELLISYANGTENSTRRKNKIINSLKELLRLAKPDKEYSATISTVIMSDDIYDSIKQTLLTLSLWDQELETLHNDAYKSCLLKNKSA